MNFILDVMIIRCANFGRENSEFDSMGSEHCFELKWYHDDVVATVYRYISWWIFSANIG